MGIIKYLHISLLLWTIIFVNIISVSSQSIDSLKFSFHTVVKSETSYGIAKKYQISLINTMIGRANNHQYKTKEMNEAVKIFKKRLKELVN